MYNLNIQITKSDLSQWISGVYEPRQNKLTVLAEALGTNEVWLMGFDVSPERKDSRAQAEKDFDILYRYSMLNERDKKIVSDMIDCMLSN